MEKRAAVADVSAVIKTNTDKQIVANAVNAGYISAKISQSTDRIQESVVRMQTGIQTSIAKQTYAIIASQAALARTFEKGFDKINNTLDLGFSGISNQLGSMNATMSIGFFKLEHTIDKMSKEICDKLDAIHDIVNNPLLTQSRELYRRAVANYNKGFYEEALEDIKSAVEKNKTDYISWYLLGKIYLFGASEFGNVINLDEAINSFTNGAKYSKPDVAESNEARMMAAEVYFNLGLAKLTKSNDLVFNKKEAEGKIILAEAQNAFDQSFVLSNRMYEALYNSSRCSLLLGNTEKSLSELEQVILKDRNYAVKAAGDADFSSIEEKVFALIDKIKKSIYGEVKNKYNHLTQLIKDTEFFDGQFAKMLQGLIKEWVPETFDGNMPYFDIRDGFEMFPVIIRYLELEQMPPDRLVAELYPKDCPYSDFYLKDGMHPVGMKIYNEVYRNSLICYLDQNWADDYKFRNEKGIYNLEGVYGYSRLLTYEYKHAGQEGKIVFNHPADTELKKYGKPSKDQEAREDKPLFSREIKPIWKIKHEKGGAYYLADANEEIIIPLNGIKCGSGSKYYMSQSVSGAGAMIYEGNIFAFLDKNTLLVYPKVIEDNKYPIQVFQTSVASNKEAKEREQAKKAEAEKIEESEKEYAATREASGKPIRDKINEYTQKLRGYKFSKEEEMRIYYWYQYFKAIKENVEKNEEIPTWCKRDANLPDSWEEILKNDKKLLDEVYEAAQKVLFVVVGQRERRKTIRGVLIAGGVIAALVFAIRACVG